MIPNNNGIEYEIIPTREQYPSLLVKIDGKPQAVHSRLFPSKEAEAMRLELEPGTSNICIVLGIGMGYHLMPLKEYAPLYKHVILVDILGSAPENIESSKMCRFLLHADNIRILSGLSIEEIGKQLAAVINLEKKANIKALTHTASMRIFPKYYEAVKHEITSLVNNKAGNIATLRAFGRQYVRNCIKNIALMHEMFPVKDFFKKFEGQNAVVITSGPSLENSMPALRAASARIFTIAVDSALPVCAAFGFRPDFVISIDPQAYISEHLAGFWDEPLRIITSLPAWRCNLENYESKWQRYCSLNSHPFAQLIEEFTPDSVGCLNSRTGSVVGDALLFAVLCGFSRIAFAGLDSAFLDGKIYSRGTAYQRRYANIFQNRLQSIETLNMNYIRKPPLRENGLATRRVFSRYRDAVEHLLKSVVNTEFFHINPPASALEPCRAANMNEFLDAFCKKDINKTSIFSQIADTKKPLREIINFDELTSLISKDEIFNKLLASSLQETAPHYDAARKLFRRLIGK